MVASYKKDFYCKHLIILTFNYNSHIDIRIFATYRTLAMGTYLSTTEVTLERHGIEVQHTDYTAAFAVFAILMLMCIPLALLFEPTVSYL